MTGLTVYHTLQTETRSHGENTELQSSWYTLEEAVSAAKDLAGVGPEGLDEDDEDFEDEEDHEEGYSIRTEDGGDSGYCHFTDATTIRGEPPVGQAKAYIVNVSWSGPERLLPVPIPFIDEIFTDPRDANKAAQRYIDELVQTRSPANLEKIVHLTHTIHIEACYGRDRDRVKVVVEVRELSLSTGILAKLLAKAMPTSAGERTTMKPYEVVTMGHRETDGDEDRTDDSGSEASEDDDSGTEAEEDEAKEKRKTDRAGPEPPAKRTRRS